MGPELTLCPQCLGHAEDGSGRSCHQDVLKVQDRRAWLERPGSGGTQLLPGPLCPPPPCSRHRRCHLGPGRWLALWEPAELLLRQKVSRGEGTPSPGPAASLPPLEDDAASLHGDLGATSTLGEGGGRGK